MKRIICILIFIFIVFIVCDLILNTTVTVEGLECRRGSGKAIIRLIKLLYNLNIKGWFYLGVSTMVSVANSFSMKKFVPFIIGKITAIRIPNFKILIVPKNNISISIVLFFALFAFTGVFCEKAEDKEEFLFLGMICSGMMLLNFAFTTFRNHAFIIQDNTYYVSQIAILGRFRKFEVTNSKRKSKYDKKGNFLFWEITDNNKKTFRVYPESYSTRGRVYINEMLNKMQTI